MLNHNIVKRIDIFKGLSKENLAELMQWLQRIEVAPMELVFKEGSQPNGLYLLCSGQVAVVKSTAKGKIRLADLEAPSFFGEISLLINTRRSSTIRAQTKCLLGLLPLETFHQKIEEKNMTALLICVNLARLLGERLIYADKTIAELSSRMKRMKAGQDYRAMNI
ncbi:MAG: cyclic nucleotide-binding domain-containing protein [Planctomycetes bacterium]|nr:cyclic nucleotide-binding domain-containing protein [Planctomycetota bacterium]